MDTIRLCMKLKEQLQTMSSDNKTLTRRIYKEIVVLYTHIGEMATSFVAQQEEHNHKLNRI